MSSISHTLTIEVAFIIVERSIVQSDTITQIDCAFISINGFQS